jgi:predicted ArsR family transcriptional regulator
MTVEATAALVDLLGDTRAQVVELVRREARSVADLATELGVSEVAVRRHLHVLERDGLVTAETVRSGGPGRPSARYGLTDKALRLFPDRSAEVVNELLDYLEETSGRQALLGFLRWRQARHGERYSAELARLEPEDVPGRAEQLAALLDRDGFMSSVSEQVLPDGARMLQLTQAHCAVKEIAEAHPELCAYEAALFRQLLGTRVSRRQTIAAGAGECVCYIAYDAHDTAGSSDESGQTTTRQRARPTSTGVRDGDQS